MKGGMAMLDVHKIVKSFNGKAILHQCTFEVKEGEIIGLAGKSGSGKSTLLRCIQGLETYDTGSIKCKGRKGFLFQDFQLFPHMTVWENITYTPHMVKKDPFYEKYTYELLYKLDLINQKDSYPHNLSGGQKQRAALARTLALSPQVVLCDEPTSGLDLHSIADVTLLLKRLQPMTMLIASHDLTFLTDISDAILMLKEGKIYKRIERDSYTSLQNFKKMLSEDLLY